METGTGTNRRRWGPRGTPRAASLGLCLAGLLVASPLRADCVAEPARVVELELIACRPALLVVEELATGSPVWWLYDYMTSIARQVPGVLVRGAGAQ